jgi:hypothetical protein
MYITFYKSEPGHCEQAYFWQRSLNETRGSVRPFVCVYRRWLFKLQQSDRLRKKTRVTLKAVNSTVLFSADQKMILCIHDEQNDSNNYRTYTTDRTVTFENVKPGRYIAHFGSEWVLGERALRIDVREGDRKTVVFEGYVFGYLNVLGSLYPYHKMKAYEL